MNILPLFKSHYSIGRSVLTLDKPKGNVSVYPVSVLDLAIENKLKTVCLVEDSIGGFLEVNKNCMDHKLKLVYGLRLWITEDALDKKEENLKKRSKYVIFIKNNDGYKDLIKISSWASKDGFYYEKCIDFKILKSLWNENNLRLAVPFYDSFLHLNTLESYIHVPDFSFTKPVFLVEENDLPIDYLIKKRVETYVLANGYEVVSAQSVFYAQKDDFISYMTFRCINNLSTLEKPELDGFCSDTFSFERWKKLNEI